MSDVVKKKDRGTHCRIRKKVVLVVTSDNELSEKDVYRDFNLNCEEVTVRIVKSNLTGKPLTVAVNRYMRDYHIYTAQGDRVIYL